MHWNIPWSHSRNDKAAPVLELCIIRSGSGFGIKTSTFSLINDLRMRVYLCLLSKAKVTRLKRDGSGRCRQACRGARLTNGVKSAWNINYRDRPCRATRGLATKIRKTGSRVKYFPFPHVTFYLLVQWFLLPVEREWGGFPLAFERSYERNQKLTQKVTSRVSPRAGVRGRVGKFIVIRHEVVDGSGIGSDVALGIRGRLPRRVSGWSTSALSRRVVSARDATSRWCDAPEGASPSAFRRYFCQFVLRVPLHQHLRLRDLCLRGEWGRKSRKVDLPGGEKNFCFPIESIVVKVLLDERLGRSQR